MTKKTTKKTLDLTTESDRLAGRCGWAEEDEEVEEEEGENEERNREGEKKIRRLGFHTANLAAAPLLSLFVAPAANMLISGAGWREPGLKAN